MKHRVIFAQDTGELTLTRVLEHRECIKKDPRFSPDFNMLVDWSFITSIHLSAAQIDLLTKSPIISHASRCAFVVNSEMQFGIGQTYSKMSEATKAARYAAFRNYESAAAWLGVPPELARQSFSELSAIA